MDSLLKKIDAISISKQTGLTFTTCVLEPHVALRHLTLYFYIITIMAWQQAVKHLYRAYFVLL